MDLANYIVELLGIQGEVCVPGLGSFVKTRVNGYYNEGENKFYPPSNQVMFDPQIIDDDSLVNYIANKKKISTTSSAYFVEKYITNLKEQIALYEVAFTDIGWLYTENAKLKFKANDSVTPTDSEFFGYPPVKLYKIGRQPSGIEPPEAPKKAEPIASSLPPPLTIKDKLTQQVVVNDSPPPVPQAIEGVELDEEVEVERRSVSIWLILSIILVLLAGGAFAVYQYKPELFSAIIPVRNKQVLAPAVKPTKKVDTTAKASDSAAKATVTKAGTDDIVKTDSTADQRNADLAGVKHYELLAGAFKLLSQAQAAEKNYKDLGLSPRILDHLQGNLYKITLGTYLSKEAADKAKKDIVNSGKVKESVIFIQPINPKPNK